MAIYMIAYDLHPPKGENYDKLFTVPEAIGGGYWDCLDSTWLNHRKDGKPNKRRTQNHA